MVYCVSRHNNNLDYLWTKSYVPSNTFPNPIVGLKLSHYCDVHVSSEDEGET
jgi:hypothetical protein